MMRRATRVTDGNTADRAWQDFLEEFLYFKRVQGVSDQTADDYEKHVRLFFKRYPDAWDSSDKFKKSLYDHLAQDIRPATFNNRLIYLRTFIKWCNENGGKLENPLLNIKKRKDEGRVVNIDSEILHQLLELPDKRTFTGLRDYSLILLTLDTGIRPKEALSLLPCDFNPKAEEVYVPEKVAKTRVSRTLPLSKPTVRAIKRLLSTRLEEWDDEVPIFCSWEGRQMSRHTWGDRVEFYSKKLGVHIRPYDLRHAFALEYLRGGASPFVLQRTLGHSNISMTKRYVSLLDDDVRADHKKATPLNKLLLNNKGRAARLNK